MAAGLGTRMRSSVPKHLHPLLGRRVVDWVLAALAPLAPERVIVVTSPTTADAYVGLEVVVQREPRGTGDAIRMGAAYTAGWSVGRGQVVRQRVLVPRSQVRILAPQPSRR